MTRHQCWILMLMLDFVKNQHVFPFIKFVSPFSLTHSLLYSSHCLSLAFSTHSMVEPMVFDSNPESSLDFESSFAWGKKQGMGGKKKDMQFYESFSF